MLRIFQLLSMGAIVGCIPPYHPEGLRTLPTVSTEGVNHLPSYNMICDGRMHHPSMRVDVRVSLPHDAASAKVVVFQLRDGKSHAVVLKVEMPLAQQSVLQNGKANTVELIANDVFHAPSARRGKCNVLPEGCYYIEAIVGDNQDATVVARSDLIVVGSF